MENSLSGQKVVLETVLWLTPQLVLLGERRVSSRHGGYVGQPAEKIVVPVGHRKDGVPSEAYNAYREGLDSACADVVVTTTFPDGTPAVIATKRGTGKCFAGGWWMQGGAVHSYRSLIDFVAERAEKECGVRPRIEGVIGFFRTCASDFLASTMQICYVGYAPYRDLQKAKADKDHVGWRLLTLKDIEHLPESEFHWYPKLAFEQALKSMPW